MHFASRSDRLIALLLDNFVAFAVWLAMIFVSTLASEGTAWVFALSGSLFLVGYILFSDALPDGQSFGKRMMGIAVVDKYTGAPCSAFQSFVRNLLLGVLGFFDWVFIFGDNHQRLGDMAAGTIVVDAVPAGVGKYPHGQGGSHVYTAP